jgi:hypothetical protein
LQKIIIPKRTKEKLAKYLYQLGIIHDFIMPDFAGFCSTLGYKHYYNQGIRSRILTRVEQPVSADK